MDAQEGPGQQAKTTGNDFFTTVLNDITQGHANITPSRPAAVSIFIQHHQPIQNEKKKGEKNRVGKKGNASCCAHAMLLSFPERRPYLVS